jgi:hypothetical protein
LSQKIEQSLLAATIRGTWSTRCMTSRPGIGFKVLTGHGASIGTTFPGGKLVFGIFAALAEFEQELIIERTKAGTAAAARTWPLWWQAL